MTTYTYDNNGNITGWDNNLYAFEYTPDNQIKKASTSGITVGEYSYDYMRRRVSKKSFGLNISYLYDIFGNLLAEVDANTGEYLNEYIYLGNKPIAVYKALIQPGTSGGGPGPGTGGTGIGCASLFLAGKGDPGTLVIILIPLVGALAYSNRRSRKRLAAILIISGSAFGLVFHYSLLTTHSSLASAATSPTAQLYYFHLDHLGTPKKLTDQQKAVVWDMELDPFGNEPAISSNRITNNLRFPGQYADGETGLYYNMNRYYEPRLGRYLQTDPINQLGNVNIPFLLPILTREPTFFNQYIYTRNNSINGTDQMALFPWVNPIQYWHDLYFYSREIRVWGHAKYPREENSKIRHCTASCMIARKFGIPGTFVAGTGNEIQGLFLHDIPDFWGRVTGQRPWAFSLQDFIDNQRGFKCSEQRNNCQTTEKSCEQCCKK